MQHRIAAALAATVLLSLTACSDDSGSTVPAAGGATTLPAAVTTVAVDSGGVATTMPVVPGVAPECMAIVNAIAASAQAAAGQGDLAQAQAAMQGLVTAVPDDLKADAQVFADAYSQFLVVLSQYNNDITQAMQAPEAMTALQSLSTPEVQAASERLNAYMNTNCQS